MALYAVGDIHGCYDAFRRLLAALKFNKNRDTLWLVGDLVNRGAESAAVLRWARAHENCIVSVLGNHDLHLLALAEGVVQPKAGDTCVDVLRAADGAQLCAWLRRRPLAHAQHGMLLVHAGVLPGWDAATVMRLAAEAAAVIGGGGDLWPAFAAQMYGDEPAQWDDSASGAARLRVIVNALTRLRICTPEGRMLLKFSGEAASAPDGYLPWFDIAGRRTADVRIVFGHWSALGVLQRENLLALDDGCLWGGKLTAARLPDGKIFQVTAEAAEAE